MAKNDVRLRQGNANPADPQVDSLESTPVAALNIFLRISQELLTAEAGVFVYTGAPADTTALRHGYSLTAAAGAFTFNGIAALPWYTAKEAVTPRTTFATSVNQTAYTTNAFTPAAGELLILFAAHSGNGGQTPTITDSLGGAWTLVTQADKNGGVDALFCFVRNSAVTATSMTVTSTFGLGCSGGILFVAGANIALPGGQTNFGTAATVQSAVQSAQASGTPAPVFGATTKVRNPVLGAMYCATNPPAITPPDLWLEDATGESGHAAPVSGAEYNYRNAGFVGTTLTWGSAAPSAFCDIAIELDGRQLHVMPAATGVFTRTGIAATFAIAVPALTGARTLAGIAATFAVSMPASVGTFTFVGNDATLTFVPAQKTLPAATGVFIEAGIAATFAVSMPAAVGAFTETGNAAAFVHGYTLASATGVFTETGNAAALIHGRPLVSALGTFTEAGIAATFKVVMPAATGAFTFTGNAAGLVYSASGAKTLTAALGTFVETASAAPLIALRKLTPAAVGVFALAGQPALFGASLSAATGAFALTGQAALFVWPTHRLTATRASFLLSGVDAEFLAPIHLPPIVVSPIFDDRYVVGGSDDGLGSGNGFEEFNEFV